MNKIILLSLLGLIFPISAQAITCGTTGTDMRADRSCKYLGISGGTFSSSDDWLLYGGCSSPDACLTDSNNSTGLIPTVCQTIVGFSYPYVSFDIDNFGIAEDDTRIWAVEVVFKAALIDNGSSNDEMFRFHLNDGTTDYPVSGDETSWLMDSTSFTSYDQTYNSGSIINPNRINAPSGGWTVTQFNNLTLYVTNASVTGMDRNTWLMSELGLVVYYEEPKEMVLAFTDSNPGYNSWDYNDFTGSQGAVDGCPEILSGGGYLGSCANLEWYFAQRAFLHTDHDAVLSNFVPEDPTFSSYGLQTLWDVVLNTKVRGFNTASGTSTPKINFDVSYDAGCCSYDDHVSIPPLSNSGDYSATWDTHKFTVRSPENDDTPSGFTVLITGDDLNGTDLDKIGLWDSTISLRYDDSDNTDIGGPYDTSPLP